MSLSQSFQPAHYGIDRKGNIWFTAMHMNQLIYLWTADTHSPKCARTRRERKGAKGGGEGRGRACRGGQGTGGGKGSVGERQGEEHFSEPETRDLLWPTYVSTSFPLCPAPPSYLHRLTNEIDIFQIFQPLEYQIKGMFWLNDTKWYCLNFLKEKKMKQLWHKSIWKCNTG